MCRSKSVEQLRNIGIINSTTRSHLVGSFYVIYITIHGSMNIKFTSSCLLVNRPAQVSGPLLNDLISPRNPFTFETLFFFGIHNKILIYDAKHSRQKQLRILTLGLLMSYIYGAPILDVSRSHTTTQHSR